MRTPDQTHAIVVARRQRARGQFAAEVTSGTAIDVTLDHEHPDDEPDYTLFRGAHRRQNRRSP